MTDLSLSALLESTRALHERFGVPFRVDVSERLVAEESYELLRASAQADLLGFNSDGEPFRFDADVAALVEEAVDLFVVVLALLQAHGVTDDDLAQAMAAVIAKNDAKTSETHELMNGKITRRQGSGDASKPRVKWKAGFEPTAPGGDASSADGQNADSKGTE